ncbi:MAG: metallopeptidase family protein [Thermomicrobium sp.]|nr:metallopeptidase family protein [Thermomicrobium sp.]MDW7981784.1 metallopeptidase family protein [Thermomicrobium sp.]
MAVLISRRAFEELVREALDALPPSLRDALDNVAIVIEREPRVRHRRIAGVRTGTLYGLYEGVPLPARTVDYGMVTPDVITLFQGPLCRAARDRADLVRLVRETVLHELAHHFGLDDRRLMELGRY